MLTLNPRLVDLRLLAVRLRLRMTSIALQPCGTDGTDGVTGLQRVKNGAETNHATYGLSGIPRDDVTWEEPSLTYE